MGKKVATCKKTQVSALSPQLSTSLTVHPLGVTVEVVPGKRVVGLSDAAAPRVAIADWLPVGDGSYKPIARIHTKLVRLTEEMPEKLGLGIGYRSLLRLMQAGFVDFEQPAPRTYLVNLQSYFDHVKKCKADPEFWERPENLKRYLQAL